MEIKKETYEDFQKLAWKQEQIHFLQKDINSIVKNIVKKYGLEDVVWDGGKYFDYAITEGNPDELSCILSIYINETENNK